MKFNYDILTVDELVRMVSNEGDLSPREKALLRALESAAETAESLGKAVDSLNLDINKLEDELDRR